MNSYRKFLTAVLMGLGVAGLTLAQQPANEPEPTTTSPAQEPAPADAKTKEEEELAAEDAAVDEVLADAELIYKRDEDDKSFIPTQEVSADQSLEYPIDI